MLLHLKKAALWGVCLSVIICCAPTRSAAQQRQSSIKRFDDGFSGNSEFAGAVTFDPKSLLLLLGTEVQQTDMDCSHFVQYLYEQAGLYYEYMPSRVLYEGIKEFKRVVHPKPGDLIVWKGHVGIVVNPKDTTFLSALNSGVKTSSYQSNYWKQRGRPRFLRYARKPQDAPALTAGSVSSFASAQTSSGSD
jgi:hypothetical protein